jgi:hypothetical protein
MFPFWAGYFNRKPLLAFLRGPYSERDFKRIECDFYIEVTGQGEQYKAEAVGLGKPALLIVTENDATIVLFPTQDFIEYVKANLRIVQDNIAFLISTAGTSTQIASNKQ